MKLVICFYSVDVLELASVQEETQREEESEDEDGENEDNAEGSGRNTTQVQRKSLMELQVKFVPVMLVLVLQCPISYYLSLDIPFHLISIVPVQSRNMLTIFLCLCWNSASIVIINSWVVYTTFIVISFVLVFKNSVDLAMDKLSR